MACDAVTVPRLRIDDLEPIGISFQPIQLGEKNVEREYVLLLPLDAPGIEE